MGKKSLSREELLEKLRELASHGEVEQPKRRSSAMCYCPAPMDKIVEKCQECGKTKNERGYETFEESGVLRITNEIKNLGYDAKVTQLCGKCAAKVAESYGLYPKERGHRLSRYNDDDMYIFFFFRPNGESSYHCIETGRDSSPYLTLWTFLQGRALEVIARRGNMFGGDMTTASVLKTIHNMTGIGLDESEMDAFLKSDKKMDRKKILEDFRKKIMELQMKEKDNDD